MKNRTLSLFLLVVAGLALGFTYGRQTVINNTQAGDLEQFAMADLVDSLKASGRPYLPFLNRPTLRCGIYRLEAGATDGQSPHQLDEVYYVLNGKCRFRVEDQEVAVHPGDVLFVAAGATHQFYDIEEDLELLVFFSAKAPE